MSMILREWLDGTRRRVLWVDFERYAARVFAGGTPEWHRDANRFAGAMAQARGVIGSEVLAVDVLAPFVDHWRGQRDAAAPALTPLMQVNPAGAIDALLQAAQPRAFAAEATTALRHRLGDKTDLVLKLRSPRDLLSGLSPDHPGIDDFGVLDDIATALVNYTRTLAEQGFAALQLASTHPDGFSADEWEACESIAQSARYYGWAWVVSCDAYTASALPDEDADLLLLPNLNDYAIPTAPPARVGGGLDAAFWRAETASPVAGPGVSYGTVPDDAVPECVAGRAQALRAWLAEE